MLDTFGDSQVVKWSRAEEEEREGGVPLAAGVEPLGNRGNRLLRPSARRSTAH